MHLLKEMLYYDFPCLQQLLFVPLIVTSKEFFLKQYACLKIFIVLELEKHSSFTH